jgi:hypothetical protein
VAARAPTPSSTSRGLGSDQSSSAIIGRVPVRRWRRRTVLARAARARDAGRPDGRPGGSRKPGRSWPRSVPVHRRPVDSFHRPPASLQVPSRLVRPRVGQRESGGNPYRPVVGVPYRRRQRAEPHFERVSDFRPVVVACPAHGMIRGHDEPAGSPDDDGAWRWDAGRGCCVACRRLLVCWLRTRRSTGCRRRCWSRPQPRWRSPTSPRRQHPAAGRRAEPLSACDRQGCGGAQADRRPWLLAFQRPHVGGLGALRPRRHVELDGLALIK